MGITLRFWFFFSVLTLGLTGTALTIHYFVSPEDLLISRAKELEKTLHKKERRLADLLNDASFFGNFENINGNIDFQVTLIKDYADDEAIYFCVYRNHLLEFWSSDLIAFDSDVGLREGSSFIEIGNGYYEAIKKTKGDLSVVGLIPIKSNYSIHNDFLSSSFSPSLTPYNHTLEIAAYQDREVYRLRNWEGNYLFSVKQNALSTSYSKTNLELYLWLFSAFFGLLLVTSFCIWLVNKGYVWLSIAILFAFLFAVRFIDLQYGILDSQFSAAIFAPKYYVSSTIFRSLGAFMLNILCTLWFVRYLYAYRWLLLGRARSHSLTARVIGFLLCASILFISMHFSAILFEGLVQNSNIAFDLSNILQLNTLSWIGVISLCIVAYILYMLIEIMLAIAIKLGISNQLFLIMLCVLGGLLAIAQVGLGIFDFTLLLSIGIITLLWRHAYFSIRLNFANILLVILLFAVICTIKRAEYMHTKNIETMKLTLQRLDNADDVNAIPAFFKLEEEIKKDPILSDYFSNPNRYNAQLLSEYIRKTYFSGYLSRYEFNLSVRSSTDQLLSTGPQDQRMPNYRELVEQGALKVTNNFYRGSKGFGTLYYFAVIPINVESEDDLGVMTIDLTNRLYDRYTRFPPVLAEGTIENLNDLDNRSLAVYENGKLVNQFGKQVFDIQQPFDLLPPYDFQVESFEDQLQVAYKNGDGVVLAMRQLNPGFWAQLASLSFLFLCLLISASLIITKKGLINTLFDYDLSWRSLRRWAIVSYNKISYSARIQAIFVGAVILTLLIMGIITFVGINNQHEDLIDMASVKKVNQVVNSLEGPIVHISNVSLNDQQEEMLHTIAEVSDSDINLYTVDGKLFFSTQPKIYDLGFISQYMEPFAYLNINKYERADFLQTEFISLLGFSVVYAPLKDENNLTVAYLGMSNYMSGIDMTDHIGALLNTLMNVYALVIVALGLTAAYVANRITSPLLLVQRSLSKTDIVKNNEPIKWNRNDEIGALVRAYNQMIIALDESARKLARSERESAWREMAKQVAHEIKNPLTPLKLGLQLLERAWREDDPDFDRKFERFSKSFLEQIDSLAFIASEFSSFAKMPEGKMQDVDICDVLEKAVDIYGNSPAVDITLDLSCDGSTYIRGDKDQLLRSFNNLLKNAIEAGGENTCQIEIRLWVDRKNNVQISIKDNGKGIDEEIKDKIFQPNFTTKSSGTGLGLAFVKQTIESIDGLISYSTIQGFGTTFYITIPLKADTP